MFHKLNGLEKVYPNYDYININISNKSLDKYYNNKYNIFNYQKGYPLGLSFIHTIENNKNKNNKNTNNNNDNKTNKTINMNFKNKDKMIKTSEKIVALNNHIDLMFTWNFDSNGNKIIQLFEMKPKSINYNYNINNNRRNIDKNGITNITTKRKKTNENIKYLCSNSNNIRNTKLNDINEMQILLQEKNSISNFDNINSKNIVDELIVTWTYSILFKYDENMNNIITKKIIEIDKTTKLKNETFTSFFSVLWIALVMVSLGCCVYCVIDGCHDQDIGFEKSQSTSKTVLFSIACIVVVVTGTTIRLSMTLLFSAFNADVMSNIALDEKYQLNND